MNRLRNSRSLLSRLLLLSKPAAVVPPRPITRYDHHTATQLPEIFFPRHVIEPAAVRRPPELLPLPRLYCTASPRTRSTETRSDSRWYHDRRKVAALAVAISGGATVVAAVCRRHLEIVPYTNRGHLVFISPEPEHELWASRFAEDKKKWAAQSRLLHPLHPDAVRVRLIVDEIVHAAHRTLGINTTGHHHAMLRGGAWGRQPQTRHLDGLQWEVIVLKDDDDNASCAPGGKIIVCTGLLDRFKTDAEIAAVLAHEVGHIIARHEADIVNKEWFPALLWLPFYRMMEMEADYIGIMLLGAAGFDPCVAYRILRKHAETEPGVPILEYYLKAHPSSRRRLQFLLETNAIEKALELYREVIAMRIVTDQYFR